MTKFISYRLLKSVAKSVSKPLTVLFNRLIIEGIFPDSWKFSYVIPIPKKGDANDPSNHRPISLLNPLGKVMERLVFKHIYNHMHTNNLLYRYQSGFLPGIRNRCSDLYQDLVINHLRDDPIYDCHDGAENAEHYFFRCYLYTEQRIHLFNETRRFHPFNIETLLFGRQDLSCENNCTIFLAVQKYIKDSSRFDR